MAKTKLQIWVNSCLDDKYTNKCKEVVTIKFRIVVTLQKSGGCESHEEHGGHSEISGNFLFLDLSGSCEESLLIINLQTSHLFCMIFCTCVLLNYKNIIPHSVNWQNN